MPTKPHSMPDPFAGADRPDFVEPKITLEARIFIWDALAKHPEDNRIVARGQVAGDVGRKFGVQPSIAIDWVGRVGDPVQFRPIQRPHGLDLERLPVVGPNPYLPKSSSASSALTSSSSVARQSRPADRTGSQ